MKRLGRYSGRVFVSCNNIIALRSLQVQRNGIVELVLEDEKHGTFQNGSFPIENTIFIAPFYADIDISQTRIVFYDVINRSDSNSNALEKARDQIRNFTKYDSFSPEYVIVATWICVGYRGQQQNDSVSIIPFCHFIIIISLLYYSAVYQYISVCDCH